MKMDERPGYMDDDYDAIVTRDNEDAERVAACGICNKGFADPEDYFRGPTGEELHMSCFDRLWSEVSDDDMSPFDPTGHGDQAVPPKNPPGAPGGAGHTDTPSAVPCVCGHDLRRHRSERKKLPCLDCGCTDWVEPLSVERKEQR